MACGPKLGFIAPPCIHHSENHYQWDRAPWDYPLAPAPAWLLELGQANGEPKAKVEKPIETVTQSPLTFTWGSSDCLKDHPGEPQGKRRTTFLRLLGIELAKGRTEEELRPEAEAWAYRCNPPLDEWERHFFNLCSKHDLQKYKAEQAREMAKYVSPKPVIIQANSQPKEPLNMVVSEDWLSHGFAGKFVEAVEGQVEGNVESILLCLLSCFGNIVGQKPYVKVGADRQYGSLFCCLAAGSGIGKSEPWSVVSALLQYVDPAWLQSSVGYGLGSGEGLVEKLAVDSRCYCVESEFAKVIKLGRRESSTLVPHLCNGWDGKTLAIANRGENSLQAKNPRLSIWGNITTDELSKLIAGSTESVNGFGNRFLWIKQERKRYLPRGGDLSCLERLAVPLRGTIAKAQEIEEVRWSPEAATIWDDAYRSLCDSQSGHWSLGRARAQALRLTLLYTLLDGSATIQPVHVQAGLSAWAWCVESACTIFGGTQVQPEEVPKEEAIACPTFSFGSSPEAIQIPSDGPAQRLLKRIEASPGIRRSELLKQSRLSAEALDESLVQLEAEGLAHKEESMTKGRKAELWFIGSGSTTKTTTIQPEVKEEKEVSKVGDVVLTDEEFFAELAELEAKVSAQA